LRWVYPDERFNRIDARAILKVANFPGLRPGAMLSFEVAANGRPILRNRLLY